jgi:hypothetical protein
LRPAGTPANPAVAWQISEAYALETYDMDTWQRAVQRECSGLTDQTLEACADELEFEARLAITEANARAVQTLKYLDVLFTRLARLGTPVNVVMISEGLFLGRATPASPTSRNAQPKPRSRSTSSGPRSR